MVTGSLLLSWALCKYVWETQGIIFVFFLRWGKVKCRSHFVTSCCAYCICDKSDHIHIIIIQLGL